MKLSEKYPYIVGYTMDGDDVEITAKVAQLEAENERIVTLQDRIFKWGRDTFGPRETNEGVFAHLIREVRELGESMPEADPDELADCAILLFELAGFAGVQLLDEVEKKHAINQQREWGPMQEDGSVLHVEEALGGE